MGITTYLFHKSNNLEKQQFNMFFLDMGENIHFHYRDLRIELSVGEFKKLAELFALYSPNVLQEIENGYKDGVLANTNEEGSLKTFWDKDKKLTYPVKYHEQHLPWRRQRMVIICISEIIRYFCRRNRFNTLSRLLPRSCHYWKKTNWNGTRSGCWQRMSWPQDSSRVCRWRDARK